MVERKLTLLQFVLTLLDMLIANLHLLFQLTFLVQELFLHLKEFLLLDNFRLFLYSGHHLVVLAFQYISEEKISTNATHYECHCGYNNRQYHKNSF